MNHQQETDRAGQMVWSYLEGGGSEGPLISALTESLMREDANFHTFQMLEAAVRQFGESEDREERNLVMVGAARYLAAHAPTQRAMNQTLRVAVRLHRGEVRGRRSTSTIRGQFAAGGGGADGFGSGTTLEW